MDNIEKKMLMRDITVVAGFITFLWVTMCFVISSILSAVGRSHTRSTIIAIGVAGLLFATVSLVVLILHLRKNRRDVYAEERLCSNISLEGVTSDILPGELLQSQAGTKKPGHGMFVKVFDIMFIMILCFITLFAAMLMRGKTVNGASIYSFGIASALVTVIGSTVYFVSVLKHSNRELKMMIDDMYSPQETEKD